MSTLRSSDELTETQVGLVARTPSLIVEPTSLTDEDFEMIRDRFGDPRASVRPDDYYTFRMIASGDGLDSYYTRQDLTTSFPNFVRDLKSGRSLLGNHAAATFAYGNSYDGAIIPADPTRSEYEPTFYPKWDRPELRTANWLVGKYFIPRDVELNGQSTNSLIRGIEMGSQRRSSISFVVGQYVCGIDNHDLVQGWFGPEPQEECSHFPGIDYEGQIGWALMKDNVLLETSLVYMNASPSSMLLRKAELMASRGAIPNGDIIKLEERFQVRLPAFERRLWTVTKNSTEEVQMAKRNAGDEALAEVVREALSDDSAADTTVTDEADHAIDTAVVSEAVTTPDPTPEADEPDATTEATDTTEPTEEPTVEAGETADEPDERQPEPVTPVVSESPSEEDIVAEFVAISDRFAVALQRSPDAFSTGDLAKAARAERSIDLALIDAGCDTTVGSHVARTFETRSKAVRETLGEPITVEAVRSLQSRAALGDKLYAELVKDAVAARAGVQGEAFNAARYTDVLISTRDIDFVKEEIDSWKQAKAERFTPGRSVTPPPAPALRTTKEERKSLPERPAEKARSSSAADGNILAPRTPKN